MRARLGHDLTATEGSPVRAGSDGGGRRRVPGGGLDGAVGLG
ncbi:hypothetical protein [Streptomyces platensis]